METQTETRELTVLDLGEAFTEGSIKSDPNNVRLHDKRNKETIKASLEEVGCGRSIVMDESGTILAGNGTAEEARALGKKVVIVQGDRDTLVVVQRTDLTEHEKRRLALWDNQASTLGKWDKKAIQRLATENPDQPLLEDIFSEKEQSIFLREQIQALGLADGGGEDSEGVGAATETSRPDSYTRMVQLTYTVETQPLFMGKVKRLSKLFGTENTTDTITAILDRAVAEWLDQPTTVVQEVGSPKTLEL